MILTTLRNLFVICLLTLSTQVFSSDYFDWCKQQKNSQWDARVQICRCDEGGKDVECKPEAKSSVKVDYLDWCKQQKNSQWDARMQLCRCDEGGKDVECKPDSLSSKDTGQAPEAYSCKWEKEPELVQPKCAKGAGNIICLGQATCSSNKTQLAFSTTVTCSLAKGSTCEASACANDNSGIDEPQCDLVRVNDNTSPSTKLPSGVISK